MDYQRGNKAQPNQDSVFRSQLLLDVVLLKNKLAGEEDQRE